MTANRSIQAPAAVVMVRPHRFQPNPATATDNTFQTTPTDPSQDVSLTAYREVTAAASRLEEEGVRVHLFEDRGENNTPDSVFPNNWFSTHPGGHVALYPMYSPSRRRERRSDIIEMLKAQYRVQDVIDYSGLEPDGVFLEGTGAMVLDHVARVAYTARSNRADPVALERFCTHFNFEPMVFDTADEEGRPIYHTNVLMCVATDFALVGFDMMTSRTRAQEIRERLLESGRQAITLTKEQIADFAGNAMELSSRSGPLLALSQRALDSLTLQQKQAMEKSVRLIGLCVPTIEMAGGSVRCMLAGIHLSARAEQLRAEAQSPRSQSSSWSPRDSPTYATAMAGT